MPQPSAAQNQEFIPLTALSATDVGNLNADAIASQSPGSPPGEHVRKPWHPKVTVYRLMFVLVTFGLVVVLLLAFFLTDYESKESAKPYWLFKADVMNGVRPVFQHFGIMMTEYDNKERPRESLRLRLKHPPVTGYRIIVTAAAVSFGMTKAVLSYRELEMAPAAIEWIYSVVVTSL
ncbi:hypothetical protein H1R20_g741, partial [Candolleomyces eurysporus]